MILLHSKYQTEHLRPAAAGQAIAVSERPCGVQGAGEAAESSGAPGPAEGEWCVLQFTDSLLHGVAANCSSPLSKCCAKPCKTLPACSRLYIFHKRPPSSVHADVAHAGRTAQQDILPVLCPSAMNHATTLRIMERLRADDFTYQVNAAGNLPLAQHGLCSMVWRRRVYRSSQQVTARAVFLRVDASVLQPEPGGLQ